MLDFFTDNRDPRRDFMSRFFKLKLSARRCNLTLDPVKYNHKRSIDRSIVKLATAFNGLESLRISMGGRTGCAYASRVALSCCLSGRPVSILVAKDATEFFV